jgi:chromosome segregation protein
VKLSRVEIKGFKSIAKKMSLAISNGVTCIAGPNGCGKSNIIDAARWALGEQSAKSLRASSMNEVIFSGTQDVGPSSMASVTLEFIKDGGHFPKTLEGFEQVAITRRLFRSGESEYLINNVKCRLKDITDLFLDTGLHKSGYAIIEQGKVNDIIQAKPEEIRYLIEEAAEVGRFRIKRTEALRRLDATSKNLERINDVLGEVTRQRNDLKTQANKARRYQDVRNEVNEISRLLSACDLKDIAMLKGAYEAQLKSIEAGLSRMEEALSELMERLGVYESESIRLKGEMETLASSLSDAESRQLLAAREIEGFQGRLKDSSATMGMLSQNMAEARRYIDEEGAKVAVLRQELSTLKDEMDGAQTHLSGQQVRHDALVQEDDALERLYNEKRTGLFEAISEVRSIEQRIIEVQDRIKEVNATIKRRQQDLSSSVDAAEALSRELAGLEAEISRINQSMPPIQGQIDERAAAMEAARAGIEAGTHRLIGQEKTHAEILAKLSVLSRIIDAEPSAAHGPDKTRTNGKKKVSDLLSVQAGYEEAVGRSMGNALDFLIFRDHEEIVSLHDFKTNGPGFVIERPHIEKHSQGTVSGAMGVLGQLKEFIEANEGYADIVHALSQNMWVVEGLETALKLWQQGHRSCRFVTMDGMILEPTGVIRTTQEHTKYADVLKAKKEMKDLAEREKAITTDIEQESLLLQQARQGLVDLTARHDDACAALKSLEGERAAFVEKKGRVLAQKERIFEQQRTYEADLAQMNELEGRLTIQATSLGEGKVVLEGERTKREEALKEIDERKLASRQGLTASQENIGSIREKANDLKVLYAEKSSAIKALDESFEKRRESIVKDQARLDEIMRTRLMVEQSMEVSEKQLLSAQGSTLSLKTSYTALMPEYEKAFALVRAAQEEGKTQRTAIDETEKSRSEMLLKNKEFEIAYAMNLERMEGRFGNGIPEIPETFDALQARQRVGELEDRIEKMGQINFASLEAFEQAQQRWEDLHRQYEDIVRASSRLKEVISNIERQSIKSFNATFVKVKENFQEIFTAMFGGGKADLVLDEGDEIEAGIVIFASPPFKRLRAMSLLSEGEKTLCAISFIFALFKVHPSPFCILDEVDAPLDDANVIRFNRLIRSFSNDSQFLIVTHNRYTMETADILYGITFDVPGISKVVSMVLDETQDKTILH